MVLSGLLGSLVTLVVGLVVGGIGIYVGAALVVGKSDLEHALWTAGIAAVVWAVVQFLIGLAVGWIPVLGPTVALVVGVVVYLTVVNLRYRGGWVDAAMIAVVAWLSATITLVLLDPLLPVGGALGVPFV